jgi:hypothetical protein
MKRFDAALRSAHGLIGMLFQAYAALQPGISSSLPKGKTGIDASFGRMRVPQV